jgi:hypothetical protein
VVELVRFPLESGGSVAIEVDEPHGTVRASKATNAVKEAGASFERALAEVRNAASAALGQFRSMAQQPDEVEIKFGVKVDAQVGAVIAKTGLQGQFEIKLKWVRDAPSAATESPEEGANPVAAV